MKKIALYFLAFVGTLTVLFFIYGWLFQRTGATMYGAAPGSMTIGSVPSASGNGPVAMLASNQQTKNQPSDNTMRGMIIRNASISLQVDDISSVMEKISQLAENSGGYVVTSNLSQNSTYSSNSSANMSIRVPARGLNNVLTALKSLATQVVQLSLSGEDITQQYVDLQSQLTNLQTAKEQLTKIMAGATKTTDVLAVFKQLNDIQGQIDVLQGQIKYYKESVAYSLINIDLNMNPAIQMTQQNQWKIADAFVDSYHALVDQLRYFTYGLIAFFVYVLPLLFLWAIICSIVYWIGSKIWNRFKGNPPQ